VLIADDEAGSRLLLSAAVERLGHQCTVAEDGSAAWQAYEQVAPDVVITDWDMPGMDGAVLTGRIRTWPAVPYTYVLVLTGAADEDRRGRSWRRAPTTWCPSRWTRPTSSAS
jgi:CheY-like chemotaxis protein